MKNKTLAPDGKSNIAGRHIREYRELKSLSLREFAVILQTGGLDWDYTTLFRAEQGQKIITDVELRLLSNILKISAKKLTEF